MCHLVQLAKRRYCRPLVTWARADNGRFLRTGMSILIENYPHLDVATPAQSYFLWFISAADPRVLQADFGMSHPPALARLLFLLSGSAPLPASVHHANDGRFFYADESVAEVLAAALDASR